MARAWNVEGVLRGFQVPAPLVLALAVMLPACRSLDMQGEGWDPSEGASGGADGEASDDGEGDELPGPSVERPPNRPPVAVLEASVRGGIAPLTIELDATSSWDPDGTIEEHAWQPGDGTSASGPRVEHTFTEPGCHFVMLTVTDDEGATAAATETIVTTLPDAGEPQVELSERPAASALLPRDLETDLGTARIVGTVLDPGWATWIRAEVVADEEVLSTTAVPLCGTPPYEVALDVPIPAGLRSHDVHVSLVTEDRAHRLVTVPDLVAGDVYIVQGQSNAASNTQAGDQGLANAENQGPFIRSFGRNVTSGAETAADASWAMANGSTGYGPGGVGQWPLRMAARLSQEHQVPIAVFNGALGGAAIGFFPRDDADPTNLDTNYGRLLWRLRAAGVAEHVRAILWYQGESDAGNWMGHAAGFSGLCEDWRVDYPGVERIYVTQIRAGCLGDLIGIQEYQRTLPDADDELGVMSTTALDGHDGCHYDYDNGYRILGDRYAALLGRDLYGAEPELDVQPPNPASAVLVDDGTTLVVRMRNPESSLSFEPGAEHDFALEGAPGVAIVGGSASGHELRLQLSDDGSAATGLTYYGQTGDGEWVTNERGIGLLTFWSLPIAPE